MKEPAHLFAPRPGIRNVDDGVIDYALAKPADKVTIEILDPANKLVETYTSLPAGTKPPAEEADERRGGGSKPPTAHAGINRFTWNLRYPGAYTFPGMVLWGANAKMGPAAVPGTYHVRLTANGVTQTQDLVVQADPRVNTSIADLQKQFDLAQKLRNQLSQADTMVSEVRQVRKQLDDRMKASPDPQLKTQAEAFLGKLTTIEQTIYQVQNRSDQDPAQLPHSPQQLHRRAQSQRHVRRRCSLPRRPTSSKPISPAVSTPSRRPSTSPSATTCPKSTLSLPKRASPQFPSPSCPPTPTQSPRPPTATTNNDASRRGRVPHSS